MRVGNVPILFMAMALVCAARKPEKEVNLSKKEPPNPFWANCEGENVSGTAEAVKITPYPPHKGKNITVTVEVKLSEPIMSGTIHWQVQFYNTQFPMTVISENFDLCTSKSGVKCPLTIGTHNFTSSCRIDAGLPDGTYGADVRADRYDGQKCLYCIHFDFII